MRLSGAKDDPNALARVGWAVRRLTGGPGPKAELAAFLDRRDPENIEGSAERFEDRAGGWLDVMAAAAELHPITRACMGFHLWSLAGLGQHGDQIEAAVTASRIAASDGSGHLRTVSYGWGRGAACVGFANRTLGTLVGWDEQCNSDGDANA